MQSNAMHAVVCAQQETQRRQVSFLYRPGAIRSCGSAMRTIGARQGKQAKYLVEGVLGVHSMSGHARGGGGRAAPKDERSDIKKG
eukprot:6203316-Pleurochrysis_carterae.AAC.1